MAKKPATPKIGRWIKADGTVQEVVPEKGTKFTLPELQKLVVLPRGMGW